MSNRVLIVEDEESILKLIEFNLIREGFEVITTDDGLRALELVRTKRPDFIILDLMLPGMNGMDVCKQIRKEGFSTPILILTAKDAEIDRILGLEMGADDYVTKPFSPRELVARVRAILRRSNTEEKSQEGIYHFGDITIDENRYVVSVRDESVDLTHREFELLLYLAKNMNRVLSRDQLLDKMLGTNLLDTRVVDVHISHLRDKLEKDPKNPRHIKTVRGVGYKLVDGQDTSEF